MVGFFRNLAQAAKEGYNAAKQELAAQQAQQNGHSQNHVYQQQQLQQGQQSNHNTQQYQQPHQQVSQAPSPQQQQYQTYVQPQQQQQSPPPQQQQFQTTSPQQHYQSQSPPAQHQPQQQHHQSSVPAQQALPQYQQPHPVRSPAPSFQTPTSQPQSPAAPNQHNPSPGCAGYDGIKVGQYYTTVVAPNLAFCPSCYQVFVASSPYASRFNAVVDTSNGQATCDMAFKAVRDAWRDTCAKANSTTAASDREVWLQHFATQYNEIMARVTQLVAQVQALGQEVQVGQLQADFAQKSSMIQIAHGHSIQAIDNSQILGNYTWTNRGSITADVGNARFGQAMQLQQGVHMKRYQLNVAQAELRTVIGSDEHGKPTWT